MASYGIYGRTLASELSLPELPPSSSAPDLRFARGKIDEPSGEWFEIWPVPDGRPWVRGIKLPCGYVIRYEDRADFMVDPDRGTIICDDDTVSGCPDDMMRHFLLDQVVPLMLSLETPVLHASSVLIGGTMAAFIGPGGAGKSTLAVGLGRLGHPVGSDDGLMLARGIDGFVGIPAYAGARLCPDSAQAVAARPPIASAAAREKVRVRDGLPFFTGPAPLSRLYVVDPRPSPHIVFQPLTWRETVMALVEQAYRLALDDRAALARQFDDLAEAAQRLVSWRLSYPRALEGWRAMAHAVAEHANPAFAATRETA